MGFFSKMIEKIGGGSAAEQAEATSITSILNMDPVKRATGASAPKMSFGGNEFTWNGKGWSKKKVGEVTAADLPQFELNGDTLTITTAV